MCLMFMYSIYVMPKIADSFTNWTRVRCTYIQYIATTAADPVK